MSLTSIFYFGSAAEISIQLRNNQFEALRSLPHVDLSGGISQSFLMEPDFNLLFKGAPTKAGLKSFNSLIEADISPSEDPEFGVYRLSPASCLPWSKLHVAILQRFNEQWNADRRRAWELSKKNGCLGRAAFWKSFAGIFIGLGAGVIMGEDIRGLYYLVGALLVLITCAVLFDRPWKRRRHCLLLVAMMKWLNTSSQM